MLVVSGRSLGPVVFVMALASFHAAHSVEIVNKSGDVVTSATDLGSSGTFGSMLWLGSYPPGVGPDDGVPVSFVSAGSSSSAGAIKASGFYDLINNDLGAAASAKGLAYEASARTELEYVIRNDTGGTATFDLNFLIGEGYIYAGFLDPSNDSDAQATANYTASIQVNGTDVWVTTASLTVQNILPGSFDPNIIYSSIGSDEVLYDLAAVEDAILSPNPSEFTSESTEIFVGLSWDPQTFDVNLGTFDNNEEFTLTYVMEAQVSSSVVSDDLRSLTGVSIRDPFEISSTYEDALAALDAASEAKFAEFEALLEACFGPTPTIPIDECDPRLEQLDEELMALDDQRQSIQDQFDGLVGNRGAAPFLVSSTPFNEPDSPVPVPATLLLFGLGLGLFGAMRIAGEKRT